MCILLKNFSPKKLKIKARTPLAQLLPFTKHFHTTPWTPPSPPHPLLHNPRIILPPCRITIALSTLLIPPLPHLAPPHSKYLHNLIILIIIIVIVFKMSSLTQLHLCHFSLPPLGIIQAPLKILSLQPQIFSTTHSISHPLISIPLLTTTPPIILKTTHIILLLPTSHKQQLYHAIIMIIYLFLQNTTIIIIIILFHLNFLIFVYIINLINPVFLHSCL